MIIIGEKINGSIPSVAKAIAARDADFLINLAKKQEEAGATFIDVCASVDPEIEFETLKWMVEVIQDNIDTPLCIDSPNADMLLDILPICKKPGLFNSVSMEGTKVDHVFPVLANTKWECFALLSDDKGIPKTAADRIRVFENLMAKVDHVFPAIANTKWECFALLSDDKGIPKTAADRIRVFENLMAKAKEYGIAPNRLHIDPLVEMLCTSENGIETVIEVITYIKEHYPTIHISGAISNISFNLPARKLVNMGFVTLAMNAGMDSGIFDPCDKTLLGIIYATEALLGLDDFCMEYITAYREERIAPPAVKKA